MVWKIICRRWCISWWKALKAGNILRWIILICISQTLWLDSCQSYFIGIWRQEQPIVKQKKYLNRLFILRIIKEIFMWLKSTFGLCRRYFFCSKRGLVACFRAFYGGLRWFVTKSSQFEGLRVGRICGITIIVKHIIIKKNKKNEKKIYYSGRWGDNLNSWYVGCIWWSSDRLSI